ncbi:YciI family protein [Sphingomonas sp. BIUV-7]|uniref:YciI family protein n=1 Tax=Sphingomonas natans TaxID=3063330 RepID=A0ABT8YAQ7_9SPHN|nr:YciI family protein [Sphingomonas sp. BIUV-7]MDO6415417.1 YciI family protein [Sphingomonas sp. BIUV-7]
MTTGRLHMRRYSFGLGINVIRNYRLRIIDQMLNIEEAREATRQRISSVEFGFMIDENGPHYFVAFQTPGPNWVRGVKYNEQPDFFDHVGYMTKMAEKGLTILSGPFMERAGGLNGVLADGGMTIFKAADLQEATKIATDDPTVKSGMLNVDVKMFWVPFHE